MKIVIDIPEGAYELLKNEGVDWLGAEHILDAVANGTPLPKGHGRLIDADAYVKEYGCCGYLEDTDIDYFNTFVPTIIPAESEDEK